MSCQAIAAASDEYHYSHDETATIRIYPTSSSRRKSTVTETSSVNEGKLNARVSIESTSTLKSTAAIFDIDATDGSRNISEDVVANNGTPFSKQVLKLLSRYPLQRLLIRVGDAAASSGGPHNNNNIVSAEGKEGAAIIDEQQLKQEERARGPSGTSILASFAQSSSKIKDGNEDNNNNHEETKVHYQNQYASLLRYLLDNTLFPPCGAPLDSLRVRKHGHSVIVRSSSLSTPQQSIINVESFLPADAATFCNPGINALLLSNDGQENGGGVWGAAANNGACHSSDNWGLFDSLFASSSGVTLSELLLGSSLDATPWDSGSGDETNKRNSVWVDLQVSPACFDTSYDEPAGQKGCSITVTRGASYRVALPPTANEEGDQTLKLSLGDMLLGHDTLEESIETEEEGWKAWYPCPLSDSSRIVLQLPSGYQAKFKDGIKTISKDSVGDSNAARFEFNVLSIKDGHIDLAAPWAKIYRAEEEERYPPLMPYGISRSVQRPLGISSRGTLVSALRYDQIIEGSTQSQYVKVHSLDVLPGTLIKPRMHTLRMVFYQGGGAGGSRFVPPLNSDETLCPCTYNETSKINCNSHSTEQCGSICGRHISLSELEDHKLTLHPDGTILLERHIILQPDSSLYMMVDFDEAYLPFQKFPADANRGVDAFPSRATFTPVPMKEATLASKQLIPPITLYSPSLLLLPPVPDMSMPFNVISLSCTLWAFVLGSLLNILVRRGTESVKRELTGEKEKRLKDKINERFKKKIGRLKAKVASLKKSRAEKDTHPKENDQQSKET